MIQRGTCKCGAEVTRGIPSSISKGFQELLSGMDFICNPCGEQQEAEHERERRRDRAAYAREAAARRLRSSGLPEALQGLSWGGLDHDAPHVEGAVRWSEGMLRGLFLTGAVGVGKTYCAAVAANAALGSRPVTWTSAPLLFARLGSGMGSATRTAATDALTGKGALVLDDLDKVRSSEYAAEQVFTAIDQRVTTNGQLIVTSNLSLSELANYFPDPFGQAVSSRLAGYCECHEIRGPDRRLT